MKVVLLHGPATAVSRKHLSNLKSKYLIDDIEHFEKGSNLDSLKSRLTTISFLSTNRLLILENLPETISFEEYEVSDDVTLVFWFDHEISVTKAVFKFVSKHKGQVLLFPEGKETSVFPFLDLLGAKSSRAFTQMDKLKQAGFDIQYLITMMIFFLRKMVLPSKNVPVFVQEKLLQQKANFPEQRIRELYRHILNIDYKIKSGEIEKVQAEFLIVNEFLK